MEMIAIFFKARNIIFNGGLDPEMDKLNFFAEWNPCRKKIFQACRSN